MIDHISRSILARSYFALDMARLQCNIYEMLVAKKYHVICSLRHSSVCSMACSEAAEV